MYAPASNGTTIALPKTMYQEDTETQFTSLSAGNYGSTSTNGLILVSEPNKKASDLISNTTPATGFSTTELLLTTTMGFVLMIAVAVVFGKTKKKYIKR